MNCSLKGRDCNLKGLLARRHSTSVVEGLRNPRVLLDESFEFLARELEVCNATVKQLV
jgi:hypothetical protein